MIQIWALWRNSKTFIKTWANKKYLIKLNKKLWIIIFLVHFYQRFSWPKNWRNFEFYPFLKFYNSNSIMFNVSHLAKINSLSFDLPLKKISWFLDNINYALFIINWERCEILEIQKFYYSKTAFGWARVVFQTVSLVWGVGCPVS